MISVALIFMLISILQHFLLPFVNILDNSVILIFAANCEGMALAAEWSGLVFDGHCARLLAIVSIDYVGVANRHIRIIAFYK